MDRFERNRASPALTRLFSNGVGQDSDFLEARRLKSEMASDVSGPDFVTSSPFALGLVGCRWASRHLFCFALATSLFLCHICCGPRPREMRGMRPHPRSSILTIVSRVVRTRSHQGHKWRDHNWRDYQTLQGRVYITLLLLLRFFVTEPIYAVWRVEKQRCPLQHISISCLTNLRRKIARV